VPTINPIDHESERKWVGGWPTLLGPEFGEYVPLHRCFGLIQNFKFVVQILCVKRADGVVEECQGQQLHYGAQQFDAQGNFWNRKHRRKHNGSGSQKWDAKSEAYFSDDRADVKVKQNYDHGNIPDMPVPEPDHRRYVKLSKQERKQGTA
jgi:hypothetical protein